MLHRLSQLSAVISLGSRLLILNRCVGSDVIITNLSWTVSQVALILFFELLKQGRALLLAIATKFASYDRVLVNDEGNHEEVNKVSNEANNAANHQVSLHLKAMDLFLVYQDNNAGCNPSTGPNEQASNLYC